MWGTTGGGGGGGGSTCHNRVWEAVSFQAHLSSLPLFLASSVFDSSLSTKFSLTGVQCDLYIYFAPSGSHSGRMM